MTKINVFMIAAQQGKHPVQVRMQPAPSPAASTMTSTSMRAPTPSSVQHSTHTSQVTVAPSPAPIAPSPAMHPSPSPQVKCKSLTGFESLKSSEVDFNINCMELVLTVFITVGCNYCVSFFLCSFTSLFKKVKDSYNALISL